MKHNLQTNDLSTSGNHNRIKLLIADDHGLVRDGIKMVIRSNFPGAIVIEAANGTEAERIFKEREGRIDLLFTDVVMPAMGGQSLAESLRVHQPDLPVLFMSGHPFDVNTKKLAALTGNDFIQKPFKPLELAQKIRSILDDAKRADRTQRVTFGEDA